MSVIECGMLVPFLGSVLGAACVFLFNSFSQKTDKALGGFAAGVMTSAAVWSLLIPSMELSGGLKKMSFIPAVSGFLLGILFLLFIDDLVPHLHVNSEKPEGLKSSLSKHTMMLLAVTIHNLPEGMAVGVVLSAARNMDAVTAGSALALAIGIAVQNFPEGAIVSIPLHSAGVKKSRAFFLAVLSGVVEPLGTFLVLALSEFFVPVMPVLLGFAAGAMIYVVVEELVPEMAEGSHSNIGVIAYALGFSLMMVLDTALE